MSSDGNVASANSTREGGSSSEAVAPTEQIRIFDTTLRDGEQAPGIALTRSEKVEIAEQLARLGVDILEAGFPISSQGEFEAVSEIASSVKGPVIAALARTTEGDIRRAAEALKGAERWRIHTFISTSDVQRESMLKMSHQQVLDSVKDHVTLAKSYTDDVEFSAQDATRTELDFLLECYRVAVECGATTINVPDTVGYATPTEFGELIRIVRERAPDEVIISTHCHNDLGLAVANTLAGLHAGATQAECTLNGIGERAGNAALEEVVMALRVRGAAFGMRTDVVTREIGAASRLVERLTGYPVQRNKAIVGANAFAHEAGIHQDGMLKDEQTYQIMDPAELGLRMTLPLGKHSGRHAFARACADAGLQLDKQALAKAFRRFKQLADSGKTVTLSDVFEEVVLA
jgi:2-isopropylmalate synthase